MMPLAQTVPKLNPAVTHDNYLLQWANYKQYDNKSQKLIINHLFL